VEPARWSDKDTVPSGRLDALLVENGITRVDLMKATPRERNRKC
jgi:hypothetical protein